MVTGRRRFGFISLERRYLENTINTRPYRELLLERLANPEVAGHYLNAAIEDSPKCFLKALRNVAQARQMARVAKDAGVQRETLYSAFSDERNPTLATLSSFLGALGMRLMVAVDGKTGPVSKDSAQLAVHSSHA